MRASELLRGYTECHVPNIEIKQLTENASRADQNSVFICIRGARHDGHEFAHLAYQNGCRIFIAEKNLKLSDDACVIRCPDTKETLGSLACRFYGFPSEQMHVIGITGTKGKTTTALLLSHILNAAGIPCGYIGTNGVRFASIERSLTNTTPDAVTLQKTLCEMLDANIRTAVIEVSSQALLRHRVAGMHFETVLFTNLAPDHIGQNEHPDFENYKACKHRLFTDFGAKNAIYNADDPSSAEMLAETSAEARVSVSTQKNADFFASDITLFRDKNTLGVSFTVSDNEDSLHAKIPLTGLMNAENALLAIAAAKTCFGISTKQAIHALTNAHVAGRSEIIPLPNGASAVIDYAHNGVSLRQLLTTLREYQPNRLIALFGSVGERTKQRRHELGTVAAELCDLCILTSDNPGNEDPDAIIADIAKAFEGKKTPYLAIPDRREAIRTAVDLTQAGDILVLAGKGHENYQLIGNEKIPFSEREILADAIRELV